MKLHRKLLYKTMDEETSGNRCQHFSILKIYFNFCYYVLLAPFRVEWNAKEQQLVIVTQKLQTALCGLCSMMVVLHNVMYVVKLFNGSSCGTPAGNSTLVSFLFCITSRTVFCLFYFLYMKFLWLNRTEMKGIINAVVSRHITIFPKKVSRGGSKMVMLFLCGLHTIVTIIHYRLVTIWEVKSPNNSTGLIVSLEWLSFSFLSDWPVLKYTWDLVQVHAYNFYFTGLFFGSILGCGLVLVALEIRNDLCRHGVSITQGLSKFRRLHFKLDVVNKAWSTKLLWLYLISISYYGGLPDIILGHVADESPESFLLYFVVNNLGWILAAKFHSIVKNSFMEWIDKNLYDVPPVLQTMSRPDACFGSYYVETQNQLRLIALKHDIVSGNSIGLSSNFFTITNSFLCSMLGLVVTYAFIIFQTRQMS